jgi:YihY family inner membrane protein
LAAVIVGVGRKYSEDGAARDGARIAYYAFFSVFPLMLAFVSIIGFVLDDRPDLRRDILESAYADMPVIGPLVRDDVGVISGSGVALALGVLLAVWAGLGVTVALGQALDRVWGIPPLEQPGYVARRLRGCAAVLVGGLGLVASAVLGGTATSGHLGGAGVTVISIVLSLAVDAFILTGTLWVLTATAQRLRDLLPGVVLAAVGLLALQGLGGWYVDNAIGRASDTYGLFATVIGLLSWLSLAAQLILIAAELNAVLSLGLWPRSLTGPMTGADRIALGRYARSALRDPRQRIMVTWARDELGPAQPDPDGPPPARRSVRP